MNLVVILKLFEGCHQRGSKGKKGKGKALPPTVLEPPQLQPAQKEVGKTTNVKAKKKKVVTTVKVVIITNLEQNKNLHKMLKIQQIFPKLYRCLLYVVFHNLKPQNAGLVDVKKDLNSKRSKGIFMRGNLKNKHSY